MISAGQLSEEQKKAMEQWAAQGASIADIQRKLKEEFALGVTYMEARFLVLDLGLKLHDESAERKKKEEESQKAEEGKESLDGAEDAAQGSPDGGAVSVTLDDLALPGAMISGKVRFSDGQTAVWMIDQMGRPAIDPDTAGYRPSEEDILEFQRQLQTLLRKKGMY